MNGEVTSFDIIEELKHKNWTNNTVRTLIKRLLNKGTIKIVKKTGRTYTYTATIDEEEYKLNALEHFINTVFRGNEEFLRLIRKENT